MYWEANAGGECVEGYDGAKLRQVVPGGMVTSSDLGAGHGLEWEGSACASVLCGHGVLTIRLTLWSWRCGWGRARAWSS